MITYLYDGRIYRLTENDARFRLRLRLALADYAEARIIRLALLNLARSRRS